jgi:hypothetical protein
VFSGDLTLYWRLGREVTWCVSMCWFFDKIFMGAMIPGYSNMKKIVRQTPTYEYITRTYISGAGGSWDGAWNRKEIKKFHLNSIFFTFLFSENLFLSNLNIQQYVWRWNFLILGCGDWDFCNLQLSIWNEKDFKNFIQYVGLWIRNHIVGTLLYSGS